MKNKKERTEAEVRFLLSIYENSRRLSIKWNMEGKKERRESTNIVRRSERAGRHTVTSNAKALSEYARDQTKRESFLSGLFSQFSSSI
jgi:hypothetical protein